MPNRAPRICGCGRVVPSGVRCPCAAGRKADTDKRRPSARRRGYDTEWQREAAAFLNANPRCTCGAPAVLVRHRISIARRPDLRLVKSNWLPGCRRCNARDLAVERAAGGGEIVCR